MTLVDVVNDFDTEQLYKDKHYRREERPFEIVRKQQRTDRTPEKR